MYNIAINTRPTIEVMYAENKQKRLLIQKRSFLHDISCEQKLMGQLGPDP
jgi:hypothetical protein